MEYLGEEYSGVNDQCTPKLSLLGTSSANPNFIPFPESRTHPSPSKPQSDSVKLNDSEELMKVFTDALIGGHIQLTCQQPLVLVHASPTEKGPSVKLNDSEELMKVFTDALIGGHIQLTCQPLVHASPTEKGPHSTKSVTSCFRPVEHLVPWRLSSSFSYSRSYADGQCMFNTITAVDQTRNTLSGVRRKTLSVQKIDPGQFSAPMTQTYMRQIFSRIRRVSGSMRNFIYGTTGDRVLAPHDLAA